MDFEDRAVWPGWETVRRVGSGKAGAVYEIRRVNRGREERAALRHIPIPATKEELRQLGKLGLSETEIRQQFRQRMEDAVGKYSLMAALRECGQIVQCENVRCFRREDQPGWDVCVKMELLTPLSRLSAPLSEADAVRAGRDLCRGLCFCHQRDILHRGISPENVFLGRDGGWKLGVLGESRASGAEGPEGLLFQAPEVCTRKAWSRQSDLYSLGLTLYWMLNDRRLPFAEGSGAGEEYAHSRRIGGEELPQPAHCGAQMWEILRRACAFAPEERYADAEEMLRALEAVQLPKSAAVYAPAAAPAAKEPEPYAPPGSGRNYAAAAAASPVSVPPRAAPPAPAKRKGLGVLIALSSLLALCLLALIIFGASRLDLFSSSGSKGGDVRPSPTDMLNQGGEGGTNTTSGSEGGSDETDPPTVVITEAPDAGESAAVPEQDGSQIIQIAAGVNYSVALRRDGTLFGTGINKDGQYDVGDWKDVVSIAAGDNHTLGLLTDGTVRATGVNLDGRCNVSGWTDIVAISAGYKHSVGLRSDGTLVTAGSNDYGQRSVGDWTGVIQVAAGGYHTVALFADGTVRAKGYNNFGECNVSDWRDIVSVAAGDYFTLGLKADGTVVFAGDKRFGQNDAAGWTNVEQISAGYRHCLGLTADGLVLGAGDNSYGQLNIAGWTGVAAISAGGYHSLALKEDGTVLAVGSNEYGQLDVKYR